MKSANITVILLLLMRATLQIPQLLQSINMPGRLTFGIACFDNDPRIVTGRQNNVDVFKLDFDSDQNERVESLNLTGEKLGSNGGEFLTFGDNTAVIITSIVRRFEVSNNGESESKKWNLDTNGKRFGNRIQITNTGYFVVIHTINMGPNSGKSFRLDINDLGDIRMFPFFGMIGAGGCFIPGTSFIVISYKRGQEEANKRLVFDYTKDFSPNGPSGEHRKPPLVIEVDLSGISYKGKLKYAATSSVKRIKYIDFLEGNTLFWKPLTELTAQFEIPYSSAWIKESEFVIIGTLISNLIFISSHISESKEIVTIEVGSMNFVQIAVFNNYKAFAVTSTSDSFVKIYDLKEFAGCLDPLARSCHDMKRNESISCNESSELDLRTKKCSCKEGYEVDGSCVQCSSNCLTCFSGDEGDCKTCRFGYYMSPFEGINECLPCWEAPTYQTQCPQPLNFTINNNQIQERTNMITIVIGKNLRKVIEKEKVKKTKNGFFKIKFFHKKLKKFFEIGEQYSLSFSKNKTLIKVYHCYDIRKIWTDKITISPRKNPILFNKKVLRYFLKEKKEFKVEGKNAQKMANDNELMYEKIESVAKKLTNGVIALGLVSIIASFFTATGSSSILYLIKYFQILDILSNLGKLNVKFGERLDPLFFLIENLKFPEIDFLKRLSVIKDYNGIGDDLDARILYTMGSRGEITKENGEIFIFHSQNFFLSLAILFTYSLSILATTACSCIFPWLFKKIFTCFFNFLLNILYFDFILVAINEISIHRVRIAQPSRFLFSYFTSLAIILVIIWNLIKAYKTVSQGLDLKKGIKIRDKKKLTQNENCLAKYFLEDFSKKAIARGVKVSIFSHIRYFSLLIAIVTLQTMSKFQILVCLLFNSIFLLFAFSEIHRLRVPGKKKKNVRIFKNFFYKIKFCTQEICIFVVLLSIGMFQLQHGEGNFKDWWIFSLIEIISITSIVVAVISELALVLFGLCFCGCFLIKKVFGKKKKMIKKMKKNKAKNRKCRNKVHRNNETDNRRRRRIVVRNQKGGRKGGQNLEKLKKMKKKKRSKFSLKKTRDQKPLPVTSPINIRKLKFRKNKTDKKRLEKTKKIINWRDLDD